MAKNGRRRVGEEGEGTRSAVSRTALPLKTKWLFSPPKQIWLLPFFLFLALQSGSEVRADKIKTSLETLSKAVEDSKNAENSDTPFKKIWPMVEAARDFYLEKDDDTKLRDVRSREHLKLDLKHKLPRGDHFKALTQLVFPNGVKETTEWTEKTIKWDKKSIKVAARAIKVFDSFNVSMKLPKEISKNPDDSAHYINYRFFPKTKFKDSHYRNLVSETQFADERKENKDVVTRREFYGLNDDENGALIETIRKDMAGKPTVSETEAATDKTYFWQQVVRHNDHILKVAQSEMAPEKNAKLKNFAKSTTYQLDDETTLLEGDWNEDDDSNTVKAQVKEISINSGERILEVTQDDGYLLRLSLFPKEENVEYHVAFKSATDEEETKVKGLRTGSEAIKLKNIYNDLAKELNVPEKTDALELFLKLLDDDMPSLAVPDAFTTTLGKRAMDLKNGAWKMPEGEVALKWSDWLWKEKLRRSRNNFNASTKKGIKCPMKVAKKERNRSFFKRVDTKWLDKPPRIPFKLTEKNKKIIGATAVGVILTLFFISLLMLLNKVLSQENKAKLEVREMVDN